MQHTITVLKRSNGMFGIYINGCEEKNLVCNSCLRDSSEFLINRLMMETARYPDAQIVFTDNEGPFQTGLLSLEDWLARN